MSELLAGVEPRAAAAIYRHGGGNPFYLHQLRRAGEEGRLDAAPDEGGGDAVAGMPVPSAVAASLAEELASLPAEELVLLRAAAVAGEPFEPDLAAAIAELPPADGLDALDALLALDLVRPTSVPRRFVFRHPLVRRAVYESAPAGWRLGAHARAAAALEPRGAPAAERAHHVEQYAGQGDQEAIGLMLEAGAAAAERAPAAAARWFESALRLLPARDERQVDVRVALASSLRALGELDRCRAALLEAHELAARGRGRRAGSSSRRTAPRSSTGSAGTRRRIDACHAPGRSFPTGRRPRPRRSRSSSRWTASTSSTSRRQSRWVCVRWRRRARSAIDPSSRRPRRPSASRRPRPGTSPTPRSTGGRREPRWMHSRTPSSRRASRRSTTSPGPRRISSTTRTLSPTPSVASRSRGPSARAGCSSRCRWPGTSPSRCRVACGRRSSSASRRSRRPGSRRARTSSIARSSSSAGRCTTPGTSTARSQRTRRAPASTRGWPGARSRTAAAARAGASVSRGSSRARSNAAGPCCSSSVERTSPARCPSSAASTGRASRSPSWPSATWTRPMATHAVPSTTRRSCR